VSNLVVTDNPESERYELRADDEVVGVLEYRGGGARRALTHTEIFEGHEGQGLAQHLIGAVLDDLRSQELHVVPICPFVKRFLQQRPEYQDLVEPNLRTAFGL
jgi:predicted GNAT family acetyltransferase